MGMSALQNLFGFLFVRILAFLSWEYMSKAFRQTHLQVHFLWNSKSKHHPSAQMEFGRKDMEQINDLVPDVSMTLIEIIKCANSVMNYSQLESFIPLGGSYFNVRSIRIDAENIMQMKDHLMNTHCSSLSISESTTVFFFFCWFFFSSQLLAPH